MNSDVLIFSRIFRFFPGVTRLVEIFAKIDEAISNLKAFSEKGIQVVGVAIKKG